MIAVEKQKRSRFQSETINSTDLRREVNRINSKYDCPKEATDKLLEYVKKQDPELLEHILWTGANRLIHDGRHAARGNPDIGNAETNSKPQRAAGANTTTTVSRLSREAQLAVSAGYLNTYFVGDKRLGDCTKEDLLSLIAKHNSQINGHGKEINFLTKIEKKLPNKTIVVRKVWTEKKVRELRAG